MGSNVGCDSGSEADFQQPTTKPIEVAEIPESDVDDGDEVGHISPNATKMKGVIEHINADSDDEDHDQPVDFGEEEEEDEAPTSANPSTPDNKNDQQEDEEDPEDMDIDHDGQKPQPKSGDKKSTSPSSSKSRSKKAANLSPVKAIKKTSAPAKGKIKAPKKATGTKKSTPLLKSVGKGSASQKLKSTGKASPTKSQKKSTTKTVAKAGSKTSQKVTKKDDRKAVVQKSKTVKPKKTIDKSVKQKSEKAVLKQKAKPKTPVKTFSKKSRTNSKATSEAGDKVGKMKNGKADSSKKQKAPTKVKGKKSAKQVEDEEDSGEMKVASEGELSDASSDEDEEEGSYTPTSKLPIIGSLACSSRDANARALLDHAVQQLGKYRVVNYGPDSDVNLHAYIISAGTKRGWGVLQALSSGAHMLSEDWLSSSISEGSWQPMGAYVSDRFGKSPRSVTGADAHNRILEGVRIKVAYEGQDAASVRKLVTLCGGRVAETRVDVTITDTGRATDNGTNVTKKWLADSVEAGVAVEYQPYLVKNA